MSSLEDLIAPITNLIVDQIMDDVKIELKKLDISREFRERDRALTREEVMKKLNISAKGLYERVKLGTMPAPYTHCDEHPRWSEQTIEKYMAGEWKPKK